MNYQRVNKRGSGVTLDTGQLSLFGLSGLFGLFGDMIHFVNGSVSCPGRDGGPLISRANFVSPTRVILLSRHDHTIIANQYVSPL